MSLERGARIKTLAPDYQEKSVYKKMSLSLDFPRLERVTVCYFGLTGLVCSFVEVCLVYHIQGLLIFSSDGCKDSVEQSCKNMLVMLVSWCYFSSWC